MRALVDTSVLIASTPGMLDDVAEGSWAVSAVSLGELEAGVLLARDPGARAARVRRLSAALAHVPVMDIDRAVASRYAEIRAATGRAPSNDLWIAATALAHDLDLLTADQAQASLPLVRTVLVRSP